jgi:uncharacterized protein
MNPDEPVTVIITRTVKKGREEEFETALREFVSRSLKLPDQMGVHIMRPAPGSDSREYAVVRKFRTRQALEEFRFSPLYLQWNDSVADITEGSGKVEELAGLESWFTLPGSSRVRPMPKWKMAFVTLLAVYPASLLLQKVIVPFLHGRSMFITTLVVGALMVVLLTWVLMPLLTRLLKPWLYPSSHPQ